MGQTLIGCRPTVTVWLIDVRFNSVWRTVQLSGWRDNPFRLQQREQFLFVGSVGCGPLVGFGDRKTHTGKLLHTCGSTGASRRRGIDQIRAKNYFDLTERKMLNTSSLILCLVRGGSNHFWYWVPFLDFWFPLQTVPGTNIGYIEGMAVCHSREAKLCFRKG